MLFILCKVEFNHNIRSFVNLSRCSRVGDSVDRIETAMIVSSTLVIRIISYYLTNTADTWLEYA